jgi:DNA-binding response OmpR family regulator
MEDPIRVLAVDDDPDLRELYLHGLRALGFDVSVAEDGRAGVAALGELRPDAVVLDMGMPNASGLTVLNAVKGSEATRSIPVVVVTGVPRDDELWGGEEYAWDAYLQKPADLEAIGDAIRGLLGRS